MCDRVGQFDGVELVGYVDSGAGGCGKHRTLRARLLEVGLDNARQAVCLVGMILLTGGGSIGTVVNGYADPVAPALVDLPVELEFVIGRGEEPAIAVEEVE